MARMRRSLVIGAVAIVVVLFGLIGALIGYNVVPRASADDAAPAQTSVSLDDAAPAQTSVSFTENDVVGSYYYFTDSFMSGDNVFTLTLYADGTVYDSRSAILGYSEDSNWWVEGKDLYYSPDGSAENTYRAIIGYGTLAIKGYSSDMIAIKID